MAENEIIEETDEAVDEDAEPSGPPAWMVTFGDAISLLLTFFVLLLSFSTFEEESMKNIVEFSSSISTGVFLIGESIKKIELNYDDTEIEELMKSENKLDIQSRREVITEKIELKEYENIPMNIKEFKKMIQQEFREDEVRLQNNADSLDEDKLGFVITLDQGISFYENSSRLKPLAYPYLKRIAELLNDIPNDFTITGHADDFSDSNDPDYKYKQYLLGLERANEVANYFIEVAGVEPARISITSESEEKVTDEKVAKLYGPRVTMSITGKFDGYLISLQNKATAG